MARVTASRPLMHAEGCLTCKARRPGWFCNLPPDALTEYDSMSSHIMAPPGTVLFQEGQKPRGVSILCIGQAKLSKTAPDGKTLLVRIAKAGDVLGLSAALSETPYEVTAEALEWAQLKTFNTSNFLKFLEHHTEGSLNAAKSLNQEYKAALADACRLALSSDIAGRMAHLLLQLASEGDVVEGSISVISSTLKHEDFAAMLGSSRESVTRVLNDFKRKRIIEIKGTKIRLLRKSALEALL